MVEIVAEVLVAVTHVVDTVEHMGVPDLVDVRRCRDLVLRKRLAELKEAKIFVGRIGNPLGTPIGMVASHKGNRPREVDSRH